MLIQANSNRIIANYLSHYEAIGKSLLKQHDDLYVII